MTALDHLQASFQLWSVCSKSELCMSAERPCGVETRRVRVERTGLGACIEQPGPPLHAVPVKALHRAD